MVFLTLLVEILSHFLQISNIENKNFSQAQNKNIQYTWISVKMLVMMEDLRTHYLNLIFNLLFLYCLIVGQISLIKKEQRQLNAIQFSLA